MFRQKNFKKIHVGDPANAFNNVKNPQIFGFSDFLNVFIKENPENPTNLKIDFMFGVVTFGVL